MKSVLRHIDSLGITIEFIVGANAKENHEIIDAALPGDLWFHVKGYPSCHVIGKIPLDLNIDRLDLKKIAKQGAVVCKEMAGLKKMKKVDIDYTKIKHVTKLPTPGNVTVQNIKTVTV
jgi:predicted ribosome quality control (RQC) complex YloA/Tae2 family protein